MNTDDILAAIDHAIEDFEVGPDAMRWTPEEVPEREPRYDRDGELSTDALAAYYETHSTTDGFAYGNYVTVDRSGTRMATDDQERTGHSRDRIQRLQRVDQKAE